MERASDEMLFSTAGTASTGLLRAVSRTPQAFRMNAAFLLNRPSGDIIIWGK